MVMGVASFLLGFVGKKAIAQVAIKVLEELIKSTKTDLDDKYLEPVIKAVKEVYDLK